MSTLKMLERRFKQQKEAPAPAGDGGIAQAIQVLIDSEVQRRVSEQRPAEHSPKLRRVLDDFKPPKKQWQPIGEPFDPTPEPREHYGFDAPTPAQREYIKPMKREPVTAVPQRDAAGLMRQVVINGPHGDLTFSIQRGADGKITRMVQEP